MHLRIFIGKYLKSKIPKTQNSFHVMIFIRMVFFVQPFDTNGVFVWHFQHPVKDLVKEKNVVLMLGDALSFAKNPGLTLSYIDSYTKSFLCCKSLI